MPVREREEVQEMLRGGAVSGADGGAAMDALQAAEAAGAKVVRAGEHPLRNEQICPEARKVLGRLHDAGYKAYLCGGGVRDLWLGRNPKDFDVATDARPEQVKRVFRNCRIIGRRFRLAHVIFGDVIIETATFRALLDDPPPEAEDVPVPSRRNRDVPDPTFATRGGVIVRDNVYGTPEEDARRRDFTVNGLFYDYATGAIIDYVGGLADLEARVLRVIGDPETRFHEDPVRMVRAVRIAAQLGFQIEEGAAAAIRKMAGELANASRERMHEEMLKIFNCGAAEQVVKEALDKGVFQIIYPEFAGWLEEAGEGASAWAGKALRQFDIWKKNGLKAAPGLQYALLFGRWMEEIAAQTKGVAPFDAATQAVWTALRAPRQLPVIPKSILFDAERVMGLQVQLKKGTPGSAYGQRMKRRRGFVDGLIYLKFAAGLDEKRREVLEKWGGKKG